jgi:hypothetical protein
VLGSPAGASPRGGRVPLTGGLRAKQVSSGPSTVTTEQATYPLRVLDPSRYAQAKEAANSAYARWAADHPLSSGPATSVSTVLLKKPGMHTTGGSTPPDTTGAAGPTAFVEVVNSQVAVYNRSTGARAATVAEDTFVHSTSTCDGQIKWDQSASRYLYYALDCAAPGGSQGYSFGWSKTSSPTPLPTTSSAGNWCGYHVSTGDDLEDYGKLGNDGNFLILGSNEFSDQSGSYLDSPITMWPKPANGTTTCPSESGFISRPTAGIDFTPEPANLFGSSLPTGYVVGVDETGSALDALRMYTVTGSPTAPSITDEGDITVPTFSVPASVPQPAPAPASDVIDSLDARLTQANGVFDPALNDFGIWTQHTIAGSGGGPSVVRWYELQAGRSTPVQSGTISVAGQFVFNGAISPTTAGNAAAIDYNVGGASLLVQIRVRFHPAGSAAGAMTGQKTLAKSSAVDEDFSCPSWTGASGPCRWGDYAGATFDPASSTSVWGANQTDGALVSGGFAQWRTTFFDLAP